ncbi:MAG: hypothetical protein GY821_13860, partial [Gammaproteobacteria bacterium]|nr:hypothetical protein [Gammaproteobacteria bacterium]
MEIKTLQYRKGEGWSDHFAPEMDSDNTLILVFAAPGFINEPEPIKTLVENYPRAKIIGCSTAGEIFGQTIRDDSIAVSIVKFDKTTIEISSVSIYESQKSLIAGKSIATQLNKEKLSAIFVLSDGLCVNGTDLVKGLNSIVDESVTITGGLAGDGSDFNKTWVIFRGEIVSNCIVAVGFYGDDLQVAHASQGGWDSFGPERLITRSENNILYELDNQPALTLYKEYLGDRAEGLPATGLLFPVSIRKNSDDARRLVRTILAVDEEAQSLTF